MTPVPWKKVEALYHAALSREPGERAAFLKEACAGDEGLLREVTSLLEADERAERFIEQPAADAATQAVSPGETRFSAGARLGPYEIVSLIGAGGMGEVYRARDPRLGRDVAVKLITTDDALSTDRLRRFETEARAAASLAHPNVVTVFDVGTHDGHPYLVLELLEGETLREMLRAGVPLLRQAVTWALEVARGLAAAHEEGIVHRDLKPDNIFLTTDGRVKVLDFGLAKLREPLATSDVESESPTETKGTSPGMVLGTVGYMSPEQVKAQTPDARTDVFSLGAVLYELVTGRRAFGGETAGEALASILRDEPPAMESLQPGVPASLEAVVRRCLAKRPADRFSSGGAVEAALETVLASLEPSRTTGIRVPEARGPYPGLSAFTETDAERFFGREAEVESLWGRLRRDKLLALIGPSGAGKTSFVRAGLVPARLSGWEAIVATPGGAPMRGLGQALVGQLPSDPDTMRELLGFDDPDVAFRVVKKWRESRLEALLVVDQFEELFTLNPPEVQERFARLLGRLAKEGDVHVLLSLRDDFLMRCHDHEVLARVFEHLTPLGPLSDEGLRRALTEPAKKEGFSFEDESLVDGMLESVAEARGALPLLAFAVSRLWEKRDRERKLLTRKAYEEIGGVAGALAQHAEQTLERIGLEKEPLVRELFRNLVTAQWTRAVAEREELLSVLPDREAGGQVLDQLVDARLLTSYEVREAEGLVRHPERDVEEDRAKDLADGQIGESSARVTSHHRIEIVHESLLRAWPRLVRWQAQDEEGAVLRDQLKQASRLWEEKGRPDDLLWTGTSEREFELWQDRYPGKLTALEDDFARAMVHRVRRRKRALRTAAVSTIVALLVVLAIIGGLLGRWITEAQRAEAGKLLALAERQFEPDPTEALAYATASLDLFDTPEGRLFATRALWRAPPAFELGPGFFSPAFEFSPDGQWVALPGKGTVRVWSDDGGGPVVLRGHEQDGKNSRANWTSSGLLVTGTERGRRVDVWSFPEGRRVRTIEFEHPGWWQLRGDDLMVEEIVKIHSSGAHDLLLRSWRLPYGRAETLGQVSWPASAGSPFSTFTPDGSAWFYPKGRDIFLHPLPYDGRGPRRLDRHDADIVAWGILANRLYLHDESGETRVWTFPPEGEPFKRILAKPEGAPAKLAHLDPAGRWLATDPGDDQQVRLWDLSALPGARPLTLRRDASWYAAIPALTPAADWLATRTHGGDRVTFWPLPRALPIVVGGYSLLRRALAFSPDSCWVATSWPDRTIRLWPLPGCSPREVRTLDGTGGPLFRIAFEPEGRYFVAAGAPGHISVVPLDGRPPRQLMGFSGGGLNGAAVSPSGRRVASAWAFGGGEKTLRVWDVETGESSSFELPVPSESVRGGTVQSLAFVSESVLLTGGDGGVRRWDIETGHSELIVESEAGTWVQMAASADGRTVLTKTRSGVGRTQCYPAQLSRPVDGVTRTLSEFGDCVEVVALDSSGTIAATGDLEGVIRVGRIDGGDPHRLLGHEGPVEHVAVSPNRRWIASTGEDNTLRLWPMPDLDQPPIHTLPHAELIAKLESLTNLRVVRDPGSAVGWKVDLDRFPGWKETPTWFTPAPEWSARMKAEGSTP